MASAMSYITQGGLLCISGQRFGNNSNILRDTRENADSGVLIDRPKNPNYSSLNARITSFKGWDCPNVGACDLANAGFYYTGIKDYVRCFFCGGGIKDWENGDNPFLEHAQWYPSCAYVKHCADQQDVLRSNQSTAPRTEGPNSDIHGRSESVTGRSTTRRENKSFETNYDNNSIVESEPEIRTLLEENVQLKEQRLCKICLDQEACMVFLPCGHLVACRQCANALRKCAVCRAIIYDKCRVFHA